MSTMTSSNSNKVRTYKIVILGDGGVGKSGKCQQELASISCIVSFTASLDSATVPVSSLGSSPPSSSRFRCLLFTSDCVDCSIRLRFWAVQLVDYELRG